MCSIVVFGNEEIYYAFHCEAGRGLNWVNSGADKNYWLIASKFGQFPSSKSKALIGLNILESILALMRTNNQPINNPPLQTPTQLKLPNKNITIIFKPLGQVHNIGATLLMRVRISEGKFDTPGILREIEIEF